MARLGLDYATLSARNPRLVYCALSGYGIGGPLEQAAGHDANYLAQVGVLHRNGNEAPVYFDPPVADTTGSLYAVIAILGALRGRDRTGRGCMIDIGLADVALPLQIFQVADYGARGYSPGRNETYLNGGAAYYRIYATRDQRHIVLRRNRGKILAKLLPRRRSSGMDRAAIGAVAATCADARSRRVFRDADARRMRRALRRGRLLFQPGPERGRGARIAACPPTRPGAARAFGQYRPCSRRASTASRRRRGLCLASRRKEASRAAPNRPPPSRDAPQSRGSLRARGSAPCRRTVRPGLRRCGAALPRPRLCGSARIDREVAVLRGRSRDHVVEPHPPQDPAPSRPRMNRPSSETSGTPHWTTCIAVLKPENPTVSRTAVVRARRPKKERPGNQSTKRKCCCGRSPARLNACSRRSRSGSSTNWCESKKTSCAFGARRAISTRRWSRCGAYLYGVPGHTRMGRAPSTPSAANPPDRRRPRARRSGSRDGAAPPGVPDDCPRPAVRSPRPKGNSRWSAIPTSRDDPQAAACTGASRMLASWIVTGSIPISGYRIASGSSSTIARASASSVPV